MTSPVFARWQRLVRKTKGPVAILVIAAACALLAVEAVRHLAFLTSANQYLVDLEVASLAPAEPQDPDIVIAAITEDTLAQFPYRSPVDRQFLAELLTALGDKGPRAIGIDLLFDQPTEPAKDLALKQAIAVLKVPVRIAYSESANLVSPAQLDYLKSFVPQDKRALANLASDQFDVVRWIYPGATGQSGQYVPGFSRALAAAAGVKTPRLRTPIVWRGGPDKGEPAFKEFPAHAVKILPAAWFKDKIVLIGSDITLVDRHRTPFSTLFESGEGMLPGVVIQAYALSQLLHHRSDVGQSLRGEMVIAFVLAIVGGILGLSSLPLWLRFGGGILVVVAFWAGGAALFHHGGPLTGLVAPSLSFALAFFGMEAASGSEARAQRKFIQSVFSQHVAPEVVEQIINNPARMTSLEGERREMTFLFTDVADFTTLSENVDTRELGRVLNAYLEQMTEIVQKHGGMVDKFIGDAVVAIFNAPLDFPGHAASAVRCALEMDQFSQQFGAEQKDKGIPFGLTRIGVNTGVAMVGNFGSRTRHSYTASGDAVNTAARLESLNKYLGTHISVSGSTQAQCGDAVGLRPIASVVLKGKTAAITVWEPLTDDQAKSTFISRYLAAYEALKMETPQAVSLFEALAQENPRDPCVAFHLKRLRQGERGVTVVMTEK
jgi:class 3 adenylate cyclase/CHASE2 domain-containing sensor protein